MSELAIKIHELAVTGDANSLSSILPNATAEDLQYRTMVNYRSKTALEAAAAKGFTEVVQILLQGKLKAYNDAKDNALREAVMMNHVETMDVLIRSGAYVNTRFGDDKTVLVRAILEGRLEAMETLLWAGADIHAFHEDGITAMTAPLTSLARKRLHKCVAAVTLASSIHDAAVEGDAATLARLLPSATPAHLGYEAKVGGNGHRRVTALAAAARKGHLEVMRLLLQSKKVTVHQRDRQDSPPAERERVSLLLQSYDIAERCEDLLLPLRRASLEQRLTTARGRLAAAVQGCGWLQIAALGQEVQSLEAQLAQLPPRADSNDTSALCEVHAALVLEIQSTCAALVRAELYDELHALASLLEELQTLPVHPPATAVAQPTAVTVVPEITTAATGALVAAGGVGVQRVGEQ